jgi:hypothetical protein
VPADGSACPTRRGCQMWPIPLRSDSITRVGVGLDGIVHTTVYYGSWWTVMHCKLLIGSCKFKFDGKKIRLFEYKFDHFFTIRGPKFLKKTLKN